MTWQGTRSCRRCSRSLLPHDIAPRGQTDSYCTLCAARIRHERERATRVRDARRVVLEQLLADGVSLPEIARRLDISRSRAEQLRNQVRRQTRSG